MEKAGMDTGFKQGLLPLHRVWPNKADPNKAFTRILGGAYSKAWAAEFGRPSQR